MITYAQHHPHLILALAIVVAAGGSWGLWLLIRRAVLWWLDRPAAYPVQQWAYQRGEIMLPRLGAHLTVWGSGHSCSGDKPHDICVCECGILHPYDDGPVHHRDWDELGPDEQADQFISELRCECVAGNLRACPVHGNQSNSGIVADLNTWNWQDDPDLIVYDARWQAGRCWEILHIEFPRLRAELGIAA